MTAAYRERVVTFGASRGLVGILTGPRGAGQCDAPHVIVLNSGVLHRVGGNRMHVRLARALSAEGITTLRFDLSGIGDSERRPDAGSLRESVERDIAEAMEYLAASQRATTFVVMGLCSGAFDAMNAAVRDERVVGAIMVDLPGPFQTWRYIAYHIGRRLLRAKSWRGAHAKAAFHLRALASSFTPERNQDDSGRHVVGGRSRESRKRVQGQFDTLLGRGVRLLVVFTPGVETNYNHRSLFRTTFPRAAAHPALEFEYFATADHTFSRERERTRLVERVVAWMTPYRRRSSISRAYAVSVPR